MSLDAMVDYVAEHTGVAVRDAAIQLLRRALSAFAECLTASEARRVADDLAAPVCHWITEAEHGEPCAPDALYDRMQRRSGVDRGVAVESVQVALEAMARELSPQTRQWLERRLGDAWAELLEDRERSSVPPTPPLRHEIDRPRTLAEGRTGSARPLSESASQPQPDSVAEDNPYADRKVSSASDVESEPLSSSNPRSKHPLSEDQE